MITLATLPQATAQQVYDQVKAHLLKQGVKSINKYSLMCKYRGSDQTKCAAGCLIGDDEYDSRIENKNWLVLVQMQLVPDTHFNLVSDLQRVHDYRQVTDWPSLLIKVAKDHNLIP